VEIEKINGLDQTKQNSIKEQIGCVFFIPFLKQIASPSPSPPSLTTRRRYVPTCRRHYVSSVPRFLSFELED
jgi:hypothetical protein